MKKLKCMLRRWWKCCGEAEELIYRLETLRERERKYAEKACQSVTVSQGHLFLAAIPLDIWIDANHFNIEVDNGRVQIKATVKPKKA